MKIWENIRLAFVGLMVNKLRSLLTMLGIIIGVAAVITLVSAGRGVERFVVEEFQGLGNNLLFVFPGQIGPEQLSPLQRGGGGLTMSDFEALNDPFLLPDVGLVVPEYGRPAIVTFQREEARTTITGTTPQFVDIRDFAPVSGGFFSEQDLIAGGRVAVLGQTVYSALFPNGEIPLGETIRINNVPFRVIGVMEEKGGSGFNDQDDVVFVPISTAQQRLFPARRPDGKVLVDFLYAQVVDETRQDTAVAQIELILRDTRGIGFEEEDDFSVLTQDDVTSAFSQITAVLTTFLVVIASISLLVGGIGIMNIMLVSVTERTREIGLRKAVGAKRRDILGQFLVEALVLALIGGFIGLVIGVVGTAVVANLSPELRPVVDWQAVVLAVGISATVGLSFGVYPALRASSLNPIDALRYE